MTSSDVRPPALRGPRRPATHGVTSTTPITSTGRPTVVLGAAAIGFSALYLAADVLETVQGSFSVLRLLLTYLAEAAIPLFVMGLWAQQRSRLGRLGGFGAVLYAYAYVFFASTVVFAIAGRVPDYDGVTDAFGAWMTVHGAVMVVGGVALGVAVARTGAYPRWTGIALAIGVVLVAASSGLPTVVRTLAEAVPAVAFAGMGRSLLGEADGDGG